MQKTNTMRNSLPKAKKFLACLVTLSMVLSLNSAFFIPVAQAQDDTLPPPMEGEYMPPEGDFVDDMPPLEGDMPMDDDTEPYYPEDMGPPPEVLEDMEVTFEDLDAKDPIIKRDSFLYPFKQFGRNIQETFTFDPIKDAELKLQHANQELSDVMQLVDEKGIENIRPALITNSVDWFENKLEKINDAAEKIKDEKTDNPAEVDAFLNEFADKHFYEHKILEDFDNQITEKMEEMEGAEDMFGVLRDKQDEMLEDFGGVLTTVDDPEKIPERLANIADGQEGSSFKLIKTAEILRKLEEQVPEQGKAAIENARARTMNLLEEDMQALPAIVRAEKFEEYTNAIPGDETVQLSIFEELKQLPNIPQDLLERIEGIKEFAVNRFEEKIEKFDKSEVKDRFFEKLTGDDLDDIMVLEELKAKISAKQSELRARVEQEHMEGLSEFKSQFTDVQSQDQATRFERLVKEMTTNPNPKTFRLLNELEMEVAQDPDKAAFIEGIKNKSKAEFENKFREEGDRFFDRMASFNPDDMMVFRDFEQEQFFDPRMMGQFMDHQTGIYKDHIQGMDDPMMFNRFQERFQHAPPEFINTMKQDNEFEDMMQFKMRNMMERELELKEREMRMQMERDWRLNEDDFQIQMRQVRNDDEKAALYAQRRESDMELMEREFDQRKMMMEARFENDPFCDAMCRDFQFQFMEQDMENKKWNLQEDARMREFEMEMNMGPGMGFDPFAGKCDNPESCMDFCYQNPDLPECRVHEPMPMMGPGPMGPNYMGPMSSAGVPCGPGEISMPDSSGNWICKLDPYYKPPEFFKQCPPGNIWNEAKGFCEFDEQTFQPVMNMYFGPESMPPPGGCPPGEWWDPGRNSCIRDDGPMGPMPGEPGMMPYEPYMPPMAFCGPGEYWDNMRGCVRDSFQQCGPDEYFDFYEQNCRRHDWRECPPGEYWDPGRNGCMRDIMQGPVEQCPPGQFWDFYKGACKEDQWAPPPPPPMPGQGCPPGEWWDSGRGYCVRDEHYPVACPEGQWWDEGMNMCVGGAGPDPTWPQNCKEGMYWDAGAGQCMPGDMPGCMDNWAPVCGYDNITYSNECYASQANVSISYWGECAPTDTPIPPGSGWCGDGICDGNEYCPQDCEGDTPPSTGGWCGDGMCDSYEDQWSCPSDCGGGEDWTCNTWVGADQACNPATGICCSNVMCSNPYGPGTCPSDGETGWCGDGMCNSNETYNTCPEDCGDFGCDYDGICDSDETMTSCPADCEGAGACPPSSYTTSSGACDYSFCPSGCSFDNQGCPSGCITDSGTACDYDGICESNESYGSCPNDCTVDIYCGNGACESGEDEWSCPSDCGGMTTGCGSYTDSGSCTSSGECVWCEGESTPYSCFGTEHVCGETTGWCGDGICDSDESYGSCASDCTEDIYCGNGACESGEDEWSCPSDCSGGDMTCNTWVTTGQSCDPTTGTCCSDGMCSNMSGPGTCESSGSGCQCDWGWSDICDCSGGSGAYCGNGICDGDETYGSCPSDCTVDIYCGDGACDSGEDEWSCPEDCGPSYVCGDGMCDAGEDEWSCPSDCGPSDVCGDGMCSGMEDSWSCPSDCGSTEPPPDDGGGGGYCGDGICEGAEYCPEDCGGEVLGVMSIREINKIDEQSNIFAKVWQGIKAIFIKDEPVTKATVNAYIPHKTLAANPYLKDRILWTQGSDYYKLISQYQSREPMVLGAKTKKAKVDFPLTTAWKILTAPF